MKGTRELVLKTARRLFGRNGLKKTTMDDIAAAAHIGKGTIYHYYDSKEKLFCEIAEREAENVKGVITAAVGAEQDPEKKLLTYFITRFKAFGELSKIFSLFKEEYHEFFAYVKKVQDKFVEFETGMIKKILQEGADAGKFEQMDFDFIAYALFEGGRGLEYFFGLPENHADMERKANIVHDLIMKGLLKR
jgi:AcrR family transcriptional regulator